MVINLLKVISIRFKIEIVCDIMWRYIVILYIKVVEGWLM